MMRRRHRRRALRRRYGHSGHKPLWLLERNLRTLKAAVRRRGGRA
jgi:hypothetical protein